VLSWWTEYRRLPTTLKWQYCVSLKVTSTLRTHFQAPQSSEIKTGWNWELIAPITLYPSIHTWYEKSYSLGTGINTVRNSAKTYDSSFPSSDSVCTSVRDGRNYKSIIMDTIYLLFLYEQFHLLQIAAMLTSLDIGLNRKFLTFVGPAMFNTIKKFHIHFLCMNFYDVSSYKNSCTLFQCVIIYYHQIENGIVIPRGWRIVMLQLQEANFLPRNWQ
jgi:hypothetical protein